MDCLSIPCTFIKCISKNMFLVKPIEDKYIDFYNKHSNIKNGLILCEAFNFDLPSTYKNMPLYLKGNFYKNENNQIYFKTLEINTDTLEEIKLNNKEVIDFLCSVKGVGSRTANKIISHLGLDYSKYTFDDLKTVCSLTVAQNIIKKISISSQQIKLFNYLYPFFYFNKEELTFSTILSLTEKYGTIVLKKIEEKPYSIIEFPFYVRDSIARNKGIKSYCTDRVNSMIDKIFEMSKDNGNTYMNMNDILDYLVLLENKSTYTEKVNEKYFLLMCFKHKNIKTEKYYFEDGKYETRFMLKKIFYAEENIFYHFKRLNKNKKNLPYKYKKNRTNKYKLGKEQFESLNLLKTTGIKVLIGGAGSGKTTTIKEIIFQYSNMFPDKGITLCSPTGRASQRMKDVTGHEAKTVHKTVDYTVFGDNVTYKTLDEPIIDNFIIIDETSMLDIEMLSILLGAIKNDSIVLFVGDENQLQSVGCGEVLHDLIESQIIEVYRLNTTYRQDKGSVLENCYKVLNNKTDFVQDDDFQIYNVNNDNDFLITLENVMDKYFDMNDLYKTQILCPSKKGDLGISNINSIMQNKFNKNNFGTINYGKKTFKINDKIIMVHNNYKENYFNGDIGEIKNVTDETIDTYLTNDFKEIKKENLKDMELSYAITIHKSQGSEYPITIIALSDKYKCLLNRNILYTAISRAREKVIIVNLNNALEYAVAKKMKHRKTRLSYLLKKCV